MSNYPEARKFTYYHLSNFLLSVTNNEQLLDDEGLQSKQNDTNCKGKKKFYRWVFDRVCRQLTILTLYVYLPTYNFLNPSKYHYHFVYK